MIPHAASLTKPGKAREVRLGRKQGHSPEPQFWKCLYVFTVALAYTAAHCRSMFNTVYIYRHLVS